MSGKKKIVRPRYQQIAVDLAERIVENRYKVGEKIHARSTLASTYNASPETTRKAINVLVDLGSMGVGHLLLRKKKQKISYCSIKMYNLSKIQKQKSWRVWRSNKMS